MKLRRFLAIALLSLISTGAIAADAPNTVANRYGTWGVDLDGMDRSVKPGDDFFRFVNGKWVANAQIPADRTSWGAFPMLTELSQSRVRAILDGWAADKTLKPGSDEAKVAAIYRTFLDDAAAEKLDINPIQQHLDAIHKAGTRDDIARIMGRSAGSFGRSFFTNNVGDDAKHPGRNVLYLSQSGLGLGDREFYLRDNFKPQKEHYQQYVADMLRLAGWDDPDKNAVEVVALETKIAEAHWTRAESRDRDKTYNPMTIAELEKAAPGFPWRIALKEAQLGKADHAVVRQNTALPKIAAIFAGTPVATLQAWEAFHVIDDAAPLLSKRFVDAEWEFRSRFLNGTSEQRPRWKRAVAAAEDAMGEAIGRTYVTRYFPPESKAKMEQLVADLRAAMKARINNLQWMEPATKARALEKLARFTVKIGYPSRWRDYSTLKITGGDLVGNAQRASKFEWAYDVNRLTRPVDKLEWGMTPQTVNAYYQSTRNEIVFPAAILQPPFFDPQADPAVNYGGIGGVIGHEITHGFDDQGRKSDGEGMLRDWWAAGDAAKFDAQAARLAAQYEAVNFAELPGLHITGKLTMGENIGDLGGILLGLDAYHLSLHGQPAPVIDGFTGDQRVFLGWGQVWRTMMRTDALRQLLMTNPHSPGTVRAFVPLRNVDTWYEAFGVKEGDANYVKPEDRVRIW
ncbi:MAG: M13-type metalloendopeptidase [Acidobacteriota bacterium]